MPYRLDTESFVKEITKTNKQTNKQTKKQINHKK
jgi:hypothetical protein